MRDYKSEFIKFQEAMEQLKAEAKTIKPKWRLFLCRLGLHSRAIHHAHPRDADGHLSVLIYCTCCHDYKLVRAV